MKESKGTIVEIGYNKFMFDSSKDAFQFAELASKSVKVDSESIRYQDGVKYFNVTSRPDRVNILFTNDENKERISYENYQALLPTCDECGERSAWMEYKDNKALCYSCNKKTENSEV